MNERDQVAAILLRLARQRSTSNYRAIAHEMKMRENVSAWKSHPLCSIFGKLDEEDHAQDKPMRTALVIAKHRKMPGPGFFSTVERLKKTTVLEAERRAFWENEKNRVFKHYAE